MMTCWGDVSWILKFPHPEIQHWKPQKPITGWWQLKDFWNFHPETWGNDPI